MAASIEQGGNRTNGSAAQLRFFQVTSLILALLLLGLIAYYEYRQHSLQPITLLVSGQPVTTVQSMSSATQLIRQVQSEEVGSEYLQNDNPHFKEDVSFVSASNQTPIDSQDAAAAKLAHRTHTVVDADVIVVNKKPIVALPDLATAQAAVDELRQHYVSMPPDAPLSEKPTFVQIVTIDRRTVPASLTKRTADAAAAVLWTPPPAKSYSVEYGETGWMIARKFNMSLADFFRANAGRDVNRLKPGDTVNVSKTFPPIDVIVRKRRQFTESFGGTGLRELTEIATFVDGEPEGAPLATNMITLQRATPRASLN